MNRNKNNYLLYCQVFEPDDVPVGRLVAPDDSEGLIEGSVFVVGTSMLSSVTAGSLLIDGVYWTSISYKEVACNYHTC